MLEFKITTFRGMGLSIDFPFTKEISEDLKFAVVLDLAMFRIQIGYWKEAE